MHKKVLVQRVAFLAAFVFLFGARELFAAGLVPCGGTGEPECDFYQFMDLINKVISFLIFDISMPVAAVLFTYAGFLLMSSGDNPGKRKNAKNIFIGVGIGLVIAMVAWLLVQVILSTLGYDGSWIGF